MDRLDYRKTVALLPLALLVALTGFPRIGHATIVSLTASGTITASNDPTIPAGTPWTFEIIYDTSAPDLDFEITGAPTPTLGVYDDSTGVPALLVFHYRAGNYHAAIYRAADFGPGSEMLVTFDAVNAIDLNINAPSAFPFLGGGPVFFHADFNDFSHRAVFASDALPTDPAFGPSSFDELAVSLLLPPTGEVSGFALSDFSVRTLPEPASLPLEVAGIGWLIVAKRIRSRRAGLGRAPTCEPGGSDFDSTPRRGQIALRRA